MGLNAEVPHLLTPPAPSFPLYTQLASPFLPAGCRKQQHTGTRNLGRPLEHPTPALASLKRRVG